MNLIFCMLKKLKKHEFDFLQEAQKSLIEFVASLKNQNNVGLNFCNLKELKKDEYFCKLKKNSKNMN